MKVNLRFVVAILALVLVGGILSQSIVEAKSLPTIQKKAAVVVRKTTLAKPPIKVSTPVYLTATEVKKIVAAQIDDLIKQGKLAITTNDTNLTFDKLNNLNTNYSDDKTGFQPYYIPAAALSGVGTFLSATNIGADSLSGNSASMTTLSVSDASTLNNLIVNSLASFAGGLSLTTPTQGNIIYTDSGAYLSAGGDWTNASSKDYKENFTTLDSDDVLAKISALPIMRWNYKKETSSITHIGPLAEDFYSAFQVGGSEKNISTIDPAGVALLGIQALNKRISELEKKLQEQTCTVPALATVSADITSPTTTSQDTALSPTTSSPQDLTGVDTVTTSTENSSTHVIEIIPTDISSTPTTTLN